MTAAIVVTTILLLAALTVPGRIALRARARKRCLRPPTLLGLEGWAETRLEPAGYVLVRGEIWEAVAEGFVARGKQVRVVGTEGTRLRILPASTETEAAP